MNGDGVSGCHVGTMPMLFAKYNVSSTSDSSVSNTIYIIRFSLIVMEFNILQEKTVIFLTKYSRKVNNWNSRNARQPTAEWNGFEFLLNACLTGSRE